MLGIFIAVGVIAILSSFLTSRLSARVKRDMKCLAFYSQDIHLQVRTILTEADIFFSDLAWTPSQEGFNQIGQARNTPKEIWINLRDAAKAKTLLDGRYKIRQIPTAWIIESKD